MSHLIFVFGRLLNEGWIEIDDLEGLDEDKITSHEFWNILSTYEALNLN